MSPGSDRQSDGNQVAGRRLRWAGQHLHWVDGHNQRLAEASVDGAETPTVGPIGKSRLAVTETEEATEETKRTKRTEEEQRGEQKNVASKGAVRLLLSLEEKRTLEEEETQEENENPPRHDATGSRGAGVFQNQSGRSSINVINLMRGICFNQNHKFLFVTSFRSIKRVIGILLGI